MQRHHFAGKGPYSQSYGFSSSHVWVWKLDHREGWAPKNWCFWVLVLEKTPESPLESKEIKPVNPKGNQSCMLTRRTDAEAEDPLLWSLDVKNSASQIWNYHNIVKWLCCCSVAKSCPTLCNPMDCDSSVLHSPPEFAQIHVYDAI